MQHVCGADRAAASRVLVEYKVRDLSSAEMGSSRTAEPPPSWPELLGQGQPRRRLSRGWWRNKLAETQTTIFNPRTHTAYVCRPLFTLAASVLREDTAARGGGSRSWLGRGPGRAAARSLSRHWPQECRLSAWLEVNSTAAAAAARPPAAAASYDPTRLGVQSATSLCRGSRLLDCLTKALCFLSGQDRYINVTFQHGKYIIH